eukprot:602089_1
MSANIQQATPDTNISYHKWTTLRLTKLKYNRTHRNSSRYNAQQFHRHINLTSFIRSFDIMVMCLFCCVFLISTIPNNIIQKKANKCRTECDHRKQIHIRIQKEGQ